VDSDYHAKEDEAKMTTDTQYQPCEVDEATHARLGSGEVVNIIIERHVNPSVEVFGERIYNHLWKPLGIVPVKRVERVPLEFVGEVEEAETARGLGEFIHVPKHFQLAEGTKFKCVEILPEVTE